MLQSEKTRKLIIAHYKTYPKLNISDLFKFLYQSAFGCEHLVSSLETATDYILKESENITEKENPLIEQLDGNFSRVHLSYLNKGLSPKTLAKLFCLSAKKQENGKADLLEKIETAKQLINENLLPFTVADFEKELSVWAADEYPAIHHSNDFKKAYAPSYRVIANKYIPFLPLFSKIDESINNGKLTVAIEGGSASGKSTLADILKSIYDCTVFHTDDFFLRPEQRTPERFAEIGGNIDKERFLEEILIPLNQNKDVIYKKFNCQTMSLGKPLCVTPKKLTIIEGAYSMHPEFEKYYDFSAFLNISSELQKERILKRNSPEMAELFFKKWIPLEEKYFSGTNIKKRCDICIEIK